MTPVADDGQFVQLGNLQRAANALAAFGGLILVESAPRDRSKTARIAPQVVLLTRR
jgi:hypothetical protein